AAPRDLEDHVSHRVRQPIDGGSGDVLVAWQPERSPAEPVHLRELMAWHAGVPIRPELADLHPTSLQPGQHPVSLLHLERIEQRAYARRETVEHRWHEVAESVFELTVIASAALHDSSEVLARQHPQRDGADLKPETGAFEHRRPRRHGVDAGPAKGRSAKTDRGIPHAPASL